MLSLNFIQIIIFVVVSVIHALTCFLRKPIALLEDSLEMNLLISPSDYYFLKNSMKLAMAFSQIYLSGYSDNKLPRKLIASCLILSGGVMLFFGKIDNYDAMVILVIISGIFQGLIWPSLCKLLFFWIEDSKLNTFFGLISIAEYLGTLLANFLTLYVLGKYSSWNFVYPMLSSVVVFTSILPFLSLYLPQELKIQVPDKKIWETLSLRVSLKDKFTLPGVFDLAMAIFCLRLVKSAVLFWVPDFLIHKIDHTDYRTDIAITIYKIGNLFGSMGIGFIGKKESILIQSLVFLAVGIFSFILFWLTISWGFIWNINFLALSGFAIGGPTGALSASFAVSLGELDGKRCGGSVVGIINGFGEVGEIFEQTIVSFVIETYGWNSMFILLINLLCFSAFLVNRAHSATNPILVKNRQYVTTSNSLSI